MPRYGDKIRGQNRWEVVNYVRQLQAPPGPVGGRRPPAGRNRLMGSTLSAGQTRRPLRDRPGYGLFVGLGIVLALVGLAVFILTLNGEQADRAWHLFHVNWVYFTGLTGGSFAFVAVQKVTKAKWSGADHPVRRGGRRSSPGRCR